MPLPLVPLALPAEDAAREIGKDAGEQLKAEAQKDGTVFDW